MQAANAGLDDVGPPVFNSVAFACTAGAFNEDGNVTAAAIQSIFGSGTNNNASFTSTLSNVFVNGANETAVTAFNASTLGSFFVATPYIGAVRDEIGRASWRERVCQYV